MPTIDEIKKEVDAQLKGMSPEKTVIFDMDKDDKLIGNYTLNYFPEGEVIDILSKEKDKINKIQDNLMYLEKDKWHITLIGEIDLETDINKLINVLMNELDKIEVSFNICGHATNKTTASFLAYPTFDLHCFREKVRNQLGIKGTDYTIYSSVYEFMGWINFVRFTNRPTLQFFEYLYKNKDVNFGNLELGTIKLLRNRSRTLRDGQFEVVHEFAV